MQLTSKVFQLKHLIYQAMITVTVLGSLKKNMLFAVFFKVNAYKSNWIDLFVINNFGMTLNRSLIRNLDGHERILKERTMNSINYF